MFGHNQFNWNQIQHLMAEGDYSWRQTGNKNLEYAAKDPECLNQFKSSMDILGPDGLPIKVTENVQDEDGVVPTWENLPKGSTIKWSAKTLADDEEPASDRVQMELWWMDDKYVATVVSDVIEDMEARGIEVLNTPIDEYTKLVTEGTMEKIDFRLVMKTIYSTIVDTNDNGYYEGEIPIPSQWPAGAYGMSIHYGYHAQSESSDSSKQFEFWVKEMGTLIIEAVVLIIVAIFCFPCVGVAAAIMFGPLLIADIVIMYNQYMKTAFGMTGLNKYECAFPDGGWNHLYAFGYDQEEMIEDIGEGVSPQARRILQDKSEQYIKENGVIAATMVGTASLALLFIIVSRIKQKARGE